MDSRDEIISKNIGLVHACAKRFKGRGIEYDDLFQAGCIGLIKAFDNFDNSRGFQFSTYAVPVILGEIKCLFRDGGTVKVSRGLKELSIKVSKSLNDFSIKHGRSPTINELAENLKIEPTQVAEALNASLSPMSLSCDEEDGGGQIDVPIEGMDERLSENIALKQVIESLEANDKNLIILRFFKRKTQAQTAEFLGTTQVQISRREKRILEQLRIKLNA